MRFSGASHRKCLIDCGKGAVQEKLLRQGLWQNYRVQIQKPSTASAVRGLGAQRGEITTSTPSVASLLRRIRVRNVEAVPGEVSKLAATPGGSGPFGAIASYGMIPGSGSATVYKKDCIMFAKNCTPER